MTDLMLSPGHRKPGEGLSWQEIISRVARLRADYLSLPEGLRPERRDLLANMAAVTCNYYPAAVTQDELIALIAYAILCLEVSK